MEKYLIQIIDLLSSPSITDWLMLIVTLVYVGATIFICVANRKSAEAARNQIEEMQKQQRQNAGIQLYALRKRAVELVQLEKYDEVYWDIPILFDEGIRAAFASLTINVNKLNQLHSRSDYFVQHLKDDIGEDEYSKFQSLEAALYSHPDVDDRAQEEFYKFCEQYAFSQYDEVEETVITYDYREISQKEAELNKNVQGKRAALFLKMQEFIKDSIS